MNGYLICFWGGTLVAWLAYRGALGSATAYGTQIKAAFDLYRNDFLKQMHLPLPAIPAVEEESWNEVNKFLYRNVRENADIWKYTDAIPAAKEDRTWLEKLRKCLKQ